MQYAYISDTPSHQWQNIFSLDLHWSQNRNFWKIMGLKTGIPAKPEWLSSLSLVSYISHVYQKEMVSTTQGPKIPSHSSKRAGHCVLLTGFCLVPNNMNMCNNPDFTPKTIPLHIESTMHGLPWSFSLRVEFCHSLTTMSMFQGSHFNY